MSYRVAIPDSVVNTGLDSALFATRGEAERAMEVLISAHGCEAVVVESSESPNIKFDDWNSAGW